MQYVMRKLYRIQMGLSLKNFNEIFNGTEKEKHLWNQFIDLCNSDLLCFCNYLKNDRFLFNKFMKFVERKIDQIDLEEIGFTSYFIIKPELKTHEICNNDYSKNCAKCDEECNHRGKKYDPKTNI